MECKNCGKENRSGFKFCENCGERLDTFVEEQQETPLTQRVICSNCGSENREGIKFCEECGTPLVFEEVEQQEVSDHEKEKLVSEPPMKKAIPVPTKEEYREEPKIAQSEWIICGNCDYENRPGIRFCEECGQSLIAPIESKPKKNIQICPKCGSENNKKALICKVCAYTLTPSKKKKREQKINLGFPKLTYQTAFWSLILVGVLIAGFFVINSMVLKLSKNEAHQLVDSVVYSTYPEFRNIEPFIEHTKEAGQHFSTYSYSKNVTGNIEGGVEVEYTRFIVVKVNRSLGDYKILSAY